MIEKQHTDFELTFPCDRSTMLKETSRTGLTSIPSQQQFFEVVGYDGSLEGGRRPISGFRHVVDFTPGGTLAVDDFRAVFFDVGVTGYAYGFVFRSQDSSDDSFAFHLYYKKNGDSSWNTQELKTGVSLDGKWSVAVVRRLVYLYVESEPPVLFYIADSDDGLGGTTYTPTVVDPAGPGPKPSLDEIASVGSVGDLSGGATANGGWLLTDDAPSVTDPWSSPPQVDADVDELFAGGYTIAYQLEDTRTGRRSPLSEQVQVQTADFAGDTDYLLLEIVYDPDVWDRVTIYRSVRGEDAGDPYRSAWIHADVVATLSEYEADNETAPGGGAKRAVLYYSIPDGILRVQPTFLDYRLFDESPPAGGAAFYYESTMLVSSIRDEDNATLGTLRWSSIFDSNGVELFPPANRFDRPSSFNAAVAFVQLSGNVIGFTMAELIHIRRELYYLRAEPIHQGLGIVDYRAACSLASVGYYVSPRGFLQVDYNANIEQVRALNHVILNEWRSSLANVRVAYDAKAGCIFMLNTTTEEIVAMWFATSTLTEIRDVPFAAIVEGRILLDGVIEDRSYALQPLSNGGGRVFAYDYERSKSPAVRLLDPGGDALFTVSDVTGNVVTVTGGSVGGRAEGCYLYNSTAGDNFGEKSKVASVASSAITVEDGSVFSEGDVVSLSPVFTRMMTGQLGDYTADGQYVRASPHRQRVVQNVSCVWTDVSGAAAGGAFAKYLAGVYDGNSNQPVGGGWPGRGRGDDVVSIKDGSVPEKSPIIRAGLDASEPSAFHGVMGSTLAVSVETFVSDLDFNLLSFAVEGKITATHSKESPV